MLHLPQPLPFTRPADPFPICPCPTSPHLFCVFSQVSIQALFYLLQGPMHIFGLVFAA
jgi:hypothetical protein